MRLCNQSPFTVRHRVSSSLFPLALVVALRLTAAADDWTAKTFTFVTIPEGIHGFRNKADAEVAARTYQQVVKFLDQNRK